jgi:hypothetical protein
MFDVPPLPLFEVSFGAKLNRCQEATYAFVPIVPNRVCSCVERPVEMAGQNGI